MSLINSNAEPFPVWQGDTPLVCRARCDAVRDCATFVLAAPDARRFDFDGRIKAPDTLLPHMLPAPELFSREVQALGIQQRSLIVVYDRIGLFSAPRAWWMFRAMGHTQVAVLDGGLPAWQAAGLHCSANERRADEASRDVEAWLDRKSVV